MAHDTTQTLSLNHSGWHTYNPHPQKEAKLEETVVAAVKEKVWSFWSVKKSVSEVLWGLGASPSIAGYSSVPLNEDGYIREEGDAEKALRQAVEHERHPRSIDRKHSQLPERTGLLNEEDDEDPVDHSFAESSRKELTERKSLVKQSTREEEEEEEDSKE